MAAKSLLLTGDLVMFESMDGNPIFVPTPPMPLLVGSSQADVLGRVVCTKDDEKNVSFPYFYLPPGFIVPGSILCTIKELDSSHISTVATSDNKKILYIGSNSFIAEYKVITPAFKPGSVPPGKPDTELTYSGKGKFIQRIDLGVEEV